jgi:hypothetical protein
MYRRITKTLFEVSSLLNVEIAPITKHANTTGQPSWPISITAAGMAGHVERRWPLQFGITTQNFFQVDSGRG